MFYGIMIPPTEKKLVGKKERRYPARMDMDWNNYLTEDEKRQMNDIFQKVERRIKEKGESCQGQFLILAQCCCGQEVQKEQEKESFPEDMAKFLANVCDFCKKHDMCPDESLPFPC